MRFTTQTIIICYHHYLHITFIITKVLELLNKFTYKHIFMFCARRLLIVEYN